MPTPSRTVFFGFGAYVGAIRGVTQCAWWPDDPLTLGFQASALIPTDLAKNPSAVRAGTISVADIEVDDHRTDGGLTQIGPRFPQGSMVGAIWLSETYWQTLGGGAPPRLPPTSPVEAHPYELTAILYWDGPLAGRRFYGFHAKILDLNGTLARVAIWNAGRSRIVGEPPAGTWWIDLATDTHPVDPQATQIAALNQEGALFLDAKAARTLQLYGPKIPRSAGFEELPGG